MFTGHLLDTKLLARCWLWNDEPRGEAPEKPTKSLDSGSSAGETPLEFTFSNRFQQQIMSWTQVTSHSWVFVLCSGKAEKASLKVQFMKDFRDI